MPFPVSSGAPIPKVSKKPRFPDAVTITARMCFILSVQPRSKQRFVPVIALALHSLAVVVVTLLLHKDEIGPFSEVFVAQIVLAVVSVWRGTRQNRQKSDRERIGIATVGGEG